MISEIKEYLNNNKIVTTKLMARDLSMDEDHLIMILGLLEVRSELAIQKSCNLGVCTSKEKMNCRQKCN